MYKCISPSAKYHYGQNISRMEYITLSFEDRMRFREIEEEKSTNTDSSFTPSFHHTVDYGSQNNDSITPSSTDYSSNDNSSSSDYSGGGGDSGGGGSTSDF